MQLGKKVKKLRGKQEPWAQIAVDELMHEFHACSQPIIINKTITIPMEISFELTWQEGIAPTVDDLEWDEDDIDAEVSELVDHHSSLHEERIVNIDSAIQAFADKHHTTPYNVYDLLISNVCDYKSDPSISPSSRMR